MKSEKNLLFLLSALFFCAAAVLLIPGFVVKMAGFFILSGGFLAAAAVFLSAGLIMNKLSGLERRIRTLEKNLGTDADSDESPSAQSPVSGADSFAAAESGDAGAGTGERIASADAETPEEAARLAGQREADALNARYQAIQESIRRLSDEIKAESDISERKALLVEISTAKEKLRSAKLAKKERSVIEGELLGLQNDLRKMDVAIVQRQNKLIEKRNIQEEEAREIQEKIRALNNPQGKI